MAAGEKDQTPPASPSPQDAAATRPGLYVVNTPVKPLSGSFFIDQLTLWIEGLEAEVERIRAL